MYENLVKRLNVYSAEHENHGGITAKAADAIEELSRKIENLEALREISPEAEYAIDKHADNLILHMEELISGLKDKPHWIPVTERLPEEFSKAVMVYCPRYRNIFLATIRNGKWLSFDTQRSIPIEEETVYGEVTHWMPLPEPPEEEKTHE